MTAVIKRFYSSEEQFNFIHARLKLHPCPHCHLSGCLILHGYLIGYSEKDSTWIRRGRRIFCSNRNHRNGCGRTFSILNAMFIKNFAISARTVWTLLSNIKNSNSLAEAFRKSCLTLHISSIYRIFRTFCDHQPRIRTRLMRIKDPPPIRHSSSPAIQTFYHLAAAFDGEACPVARFQEVFQESFL